MDSVPLERIVKILTDGYAIKILAATTRDVKSAIDLSQELNVPIAACYRRLHMLENAGLIHVQERTTPKGKKMKYYRSKIKRANIHIEDNTLIVELIFSNGNIKKYSGKIVAG
ncbi:putative transcriptional regulator [Aciduliprofundum sp. MAR08-339]|uniref:ArsR/SmtB family transcription factor n=1 Tax=Aciduliprofundum sp. (strain MAR08-339) TaxID=673860 RepID=UPI0002A4B24D|nr:putative transcriptional regulator [Aciduliprofundum sp. MAR08-339]